MKHIRHTELGAGFKIQAEDRDDLPVMEAGEVWAPRKWSIRPHANRGWEAYLQTRGGSRWRIGEDVREIPENGGYLIQNGVKHRLIEFTEEHTHFYYVIFPLAAVPKSVRHALCWKSEYTIFHAADALRLPFQGIIQELAIRADWQKETCQGYMAALGAVLTRLSDEHREDRGQALSRHPRAERAMRLLTDRIDHPWRLEELARLSGVSVAHLIEIFRREFGESPMKVRNRLRLEEARRQLQQTDKTVTAIAYDLGFASSQHLSRAYRAKYGCTPTSGRRIAQR